MADDDELCVQYEQLKGSSGQFAHELVEYRIVPYFRRLDTASQAKAELALRYALNSSAFPYEQMLSALLIPIEMIGDPKDFVAQIWERCFGGPCKPLPMDQFVVKPNEKEILRVQVTPEGNS